jgi:hypothetical protein
LSPLLQGAVTPAIDGSPFIRSIAPDGTVIVKDRATGALVPPTAMAGRKVQSTVYTHAAAVLYVHLAVDCVFQLTCISCRIF